VTKAADQPATCPRIHTYDAWTNGRIVFLTARTVPGVDAVLLWIPGNAKGQAEQMGKLNGILPALVTPVNASGEFQVKPYEQLLERVYRSGVHGVYLCGQTGEGFQLSPNERKAATECAVQNSPRDAQVVVHVGASSTADAVRLASHAAKSGAHVISSLPPVGNYSFEEIRSYYEALAQASDLPLLIYYFPSIAPAIRSTEQILDLCSIPNIIGLKFTDTDFFRLWTIRQSGAIVLNGFDEMLLAGLIMGANGGIGSTYNLIPESFVELYQHTSNQRWEQARHVQQQINEFIQVLLRFPIPPAIKLILSWTGISCGSCILPRRELTPEKQTELRSRISETVLGGALLSASTLA
jgi:N-acetylneuraminate lyase